MPEQVEIVAHVHKCHPCSKWLDGEIKTVKVMQFLTTKKTPP